MSKSRDSTHRPEAPHYAKPSIHAKAAAAITAMLISTALQVGLLALFHEQSLDTRADEAARQGAPSTAALATAPIDTAPL